MLLPKEICWTFVSTSMGAKSRLKRVVSLCLVTALIAALPDTD